MCHLSGTCVKQATPCIHIAAPQHRIQKIVRQTVAEIATTEILFFHRHKLGMEYVYMHMSTLDQWKKVYELKAENKL